MGEATLGVMSRIEKLERVVAGLERAVFPVLTGVESAVDLTAVAVNSDGSLTVGANTAPVAEWAKLKTDLANCLAVQNRLVDAGIEKDEVIARLRLQVATECEEAYRYARRLGEIECALGVVTMAGAGPQPALDAIARLTRELDEAQRDANAKCESEAVIRHRLHETQLTIGRALDELCGIGDPPPGSWDQLCFLGGRHCEPYLSEPERRNGKK
jgi:hypothetical protein